ncbi:amiloride-sensitive sodium channel domain-containing protein [Phthorimaea operculella]|nr:amiloride-sensitive sodium channel domain-containing protein [Phthorimaea operculella]
MVDFENDLMLANEEITTRGCRYLHEVPDDEFDTYKVSSNVEYTFSMVDSENDVMLANEEIMTRGCRYLHEVPNEEFDTYKVYSYGACKMTHDTEHSFEHCGCFHPARYLGSQKSKQGLKDHDPNELDPCLPSCVESELTTVHLSRRWIEGNHPLPGTNVTIQMANLPTLRYQRNLLRTDLDMVVSVGGFVGLFFGASILSLVEILYLYLRKQN